MRNEQKQGAGVAVFYKSSRVGSLDLLKGLIMVLMALDHCRDFFHYDAFFFDPTDPVQSNVPAYLTRWITHFCAPGFCFLAGVSAYLVGLRRSRKQLARFLFMRGLWLVFIELSVVNFAWYFNIHFNELALMVIWALGVSMLLLSALIYLPMRTILLISIAVLFGHNLLDDVHFEGSVLWSILHEFQPFPLGEQRILWVVYPILPWAGLMSLGYYMGSFYKRDVDAVWRRRIFVWLGLGSITLFLVVRGINGYGNPKSWEWMGMLRQSLFGFFDPLKYPPSLAYLLMTMGGIFLFLGLSEKWNNAMGRILTVYGKVPFFYYIIHIYLIHLGAMLQAQLTGFGWQSMILPTWINQNEVLQGYGLSLGGVYLVWMLLLLLLYPACKRFGSYKAQNKGKWWLSYL